MADRQQAPGPTRLPNCFNRLDAMADALLKIGCNRPPLQHWLQQGSGLPAKLSPTPPQPHIEIVSHCWQYSHMLAYQLWSLVEHTPLQQPVTMTVYFSREDTATEALLDFFARKNIPNLSWNWQSLPSCYLFRRAIGRNLSAKNTRADWIWFTDCDLVFGQDCLNALGRTLAGRCHPLVYPALEYRSTPLPEHHPLLDKTRSLLLPQRLPYALFKATAISRATGPLQIVHGEAARACGYCAQVYLYQKPARHWCKANEDRVFRQILGTQGTPVDFGPVYRLQHQDKGRYQKRGPLGKLRLWNQARFRHQ